MSWPRTEIETLIDREPRLGLALIQVFVSRCRDLEDRLQRVALGNVRKRLAMSLIRFTRWGCATPESDGAIRIPPLTHKFLSGYLGMPREQVTVQMNHLRRQGFVRYSREAIQIYPEALTEHFRCQPNRKNSACH